MTRNRAGVILRLEKYAVSRRIASLEAKLRDGNTIKAG
jgi:hypothetical protein